MFSFEGPSTINYVFKDVLIDNLTFFRYFMTDRTENNRVFDETKILVMAAIGLTFNYTFILGKTGLVVAYDWPGGITKCSGIATNGFPWIMLINNIYHLILIICGISADLSLHYYLIQKQKKCQWIQIGTLECIVKSRIQLEDQCSYKCNIDRNYCDNVFVCSRYLDCQHFQK